MKKRFLSKSLIAKIALVLVIILIFEFAASEPVHAASLGGTLLNPIVNLVVYLSDGVMQILQSALTSIDNSFSYIELTESKTSWWVAVGAVILGVVLVVGAVLAVVFTGGTAAPAIVGTIAASVAGTGLTAAVAGGVYLAVYPQFGDKIDAVVFGNSFVYSTIYITPETILKNQIKLFDVDYFHNFKDTEGNIDQTVSLSNTLRNVVAQVYTTIRDIALVLMLIVMVYTAIRMLLALTPKEKSRYKESAVNCVIGFVLIILMHFIMSTSVTALQMITNSIIATNQVYDIEEDEVEDFLASNQDAYNNAIQGVMLQIVGDELYDAVENPDEAGTSVYDGIILGNDENGNKVSYVKASNFTEQARYMAQKVYDLKVKEYNEDGTVKEYDRDEKIETWEHIGWAFVYIMLVVLTLAFVVMYGKRTLYMAALTIFAPIVGVMYPINRANGSRAHTLNLWLREYFGNLIIQPCHLLLYIIFIGSAMAMATNNPIYVIIVIMALAFLVRLLQDLLGIQDTRIGGLGKALQDTTRAIKTTEKAATSIARTVGRTVSRGTHALGGMAVGIAAKASSTDAQSEESEVNNANAQPRVQNPPQNAGAGGGQNEPPPTAGAQTPPPILNEGTNNSSGQPQEKKPQTRKLDEAATMQSYMEEGGRKNSAGEYFNPYTNEFDANYNPLEDPLFQEYKDANTIAQPKSNEDIVMQNYMNSGFGKNEKGEYFNPYTDEYDANYDPLKDNMFIEQSADINSGLGVGTSPVGILDDTTMSMVDSLNGNEAPFTVINGINEEVVRTDGDRNILKDDNGNLRIERITPSDGRDPMAMAMAAGSETSNSTVTIDNTEPLRTIDNTETASGSGGTSASRTSTSNGSGTVAFGIPSGAQNIPDGNNLRVVDDLSNNGPIEEPIDFASRKEDILNKRNSLGENITTNNNISGIGTESASARNKY